ncbi:MAG TPA: ATP-binding protein [Candidatus Saccharimonadia bacterium]|nr:ATP-binding protein [Candidatus Saccharimonadia bacterium]
MKQILIMMLGHPGSGKSYFTKQLAPKLGAVRFNADHMRKRMYSDPKEATNRGNNPIVFGAIDYAAGEVLRAGHSAIYDIQLYSKSRRKIVNAIATQFNTPAIIIWVKTPYDIALKRGHEREETHDQRRKTEEDMKRSLDYFISVLEPPGPDEPLITIDGTAPFDEQYQSYARQLDRIMKAQQIKALAVDSVQEREPSVEIGPINNINERVIAIQLADGIDVGPEWWEKNVTAIVGNDASEQAMLDCFTAAYERDFPRGADGKRRLHAKPGVEPTV